MGRGWNQAKSLKVVRYAVLNLLRLVLTRLIKGEFEEASPFIKPPPPPLQGRGIKGVGC